MRHMIRWYTLIALVCALGTTTLVLLVQPWPGA